MRHKNDINNNTISINTNTQLHVLYKHVYSCVCESIHVSRILFYIIWINGHTHVYVCIVLIKYHS